jgi:predicted DNA-binding antitoxin AbrB/MazE fold protein
MTYVDAIYRDGVFRPLEPVSLCENQRVALCVEPIQREDALAWAKRVSQVREEVASHCGILPDSAIDIAADRMQ